MSTPSEDPAVTSPSTSTAAAMEAAQTAQLAESEEIVPTGEADKKKFVSNKVSKLREEEPELYRTILQTMASVIISDMRKHEGRMKRAIRGR